MADLKIGLRTFYRELDLLKRCGIKVRHKEKLYHLSISADEGVGRLPFPDPQLNFAEMTELAQSPGPAGKRLAELLASVVNPPDTPKRSTSRKRGRK